MQNNLKAVLAASVLTVFGGVAAHATPAFTNPTFSSTSTTTSFTYSVPITGWTDVSGSGSATGITAAVPSALWDNGVAPNGETNVAFLQNETSALSQTVGGFVVGDQYVIKVIANARAATGSAGLSIGVGGTEYGGPVLSPTPVSAVDAYGTYATPWATYTSAVFTASSVSNLVQIQNLGIPGSANFDDVSIDLGNAMILDVTAAPTGIPEPASLTLLAMGAAGVAFARRRTAARQG